MEPGRRRAVYYPERDGKPVGETEIHIEAIFWLRAVLRAFFAARPDVYVVTNLLLYYEEGNPRAVVVPDVMVVLGVPKQPPRRIYKLWDEGKAPAFVVEVTSQSTRRQDTGKKRALYAQLGVQEYFLYDPLGEYLRPPLQGFRLHDGEYRPIELDARGVFFSEALGLEMTIVAGRLQLRDPRTGAVLLSPEERAGAEAAARREAEDRASVAQARATAAEERAAAAEERAAAEAEARRALEARLAELEAQGRERDQG